MKQGPTPEIFSPPRFYIATSQDTMEENDSLSGSAVLEVDHASIDSTMAPQHAGKRSRLEEQNDTEPPNDYEASPGSKRTKTDKHGEVDAENGGAKTEDKDPKEENGNKIDVDDSEEPTNEDNAETSPTAIMSPVLTRRRANARARAAIEQKSKEEGGFTTPEKENGTLKSDTSEDANGTRIDNERWIGKDTARREKCQIINCFSLIVT